MKQVGVKNQHAKTEKLIFTAMGTPKAHPGVRRRTRGHLTRAWRIQCAQSASCMGVASPGPHAAQRVRIGHTQCLWRARMQLKYSSQCTHSTKTCWIQPTSTEIEFSLHKKIFTRLMKLCFFCFQCMYFHIFIYIYLTIQTVFYH